jgi:glutamate mutase epsilon subunit
MGWSAKDEMDFLENIGMHMTSAPHLNRNQSMEDQDNNTIQMLRHKVRLLGNYIKASELRVNWGSIDADTVIAFAKSKHNRLTKNLPYSG